MTTTTAHQRCPECGSTFYNNGKCYDCGYDYFRENTPVEYILAFLLTATVLTILINITV